MGSGDSRFHFWRTSLLALVSFCSPLQTSQQASQVKPTRRLDLSLIWR
jgi:hypothetical protein